MTIRIYVSGDVTHRKGISIEKGVLTVEGYGEDEVDAILGLVAKAIARQNPAADVNPLDRLASAFETIASKVPDETNRQDDSYLRREFEAFKAQVLVEKEIARLLAAHASLASTFNLLPIEELKNRMAYEYRQVSLGAVLDAIVEQTRAAKTAASKQDAVAKPTCIKHGLEVCKECSDISATRNVPFSAY